MSLQHLELKQPVIFIPHGGGPCFFMDWNPPHAWKKMRAFLESLASTLPQTPSAILVVSAHWCTQGFKVTSCKRPDLIFDYYGFPEHTYQLTYPAPGAPELALQVISLLQNNGLECASDSNRGLDHGVFIPLKLIFPEANIPVVQLSLDQGLDPEKHLKLGEALTSLRQQNILILGSGMSFHNMRGYGNPVFGPISDDFDAWLTHSIQGEPEYCWAELSDWTKASQARLCHPIQAEEHLLPLMVMAGAAGGDRGKKVFSDRVLETTLSAFRFG